MGQKAKSFKISHDLAEASVLQSKLMGHASWGAYVKALIRQDLVAGVRRDLAHKDEWHENGFRNMDLKRQDQYDFCLLKSIRKIIPPTLTE